MEFLPSTELGEELDARFGQTRLRRISLELFMAEVGSLIDPLYDAEKPHRYTEDPIKALESKRALNCLEASTLMLYALSHRGNNIPGLITTRTPNRKHSSVAALLPRSGKMLGYNPGEPGETEVFAIRAQHLEPDNAQDAVLAAWLAGRHDSGLIRSYSLGTDIGHEPTEVCITSYTTDFSEPVALPEAPSVSAALTIGKNAIPTAQALIGYFATPRGLRSDYVREQSSLLPRLSPVIDESLLLV